MPSFLGNILPLPSELDLERVGFDVVEEEVRELVRALWTSGYQTICSCAGHLTPETEPFPWITILLAPESLERLAPIIARFNESRGKDGYLPRAIDTWTLSPLITVSGLCVYLQPVDINQGRSLDRLSELQRDGQSLAAFISADEAQKK